MRTTLATDEPERPEEPPRRGPTTWRKVMFGSLLGLAILFALLTPFFGGFNVFLAIFIAVPLIAAFLVRRGGRGSVIFGLVVAILFVLANAQFFLIPAFSQPASTGDFISAAIVVVLCVLAVIAAIVILRSGDTPTEAPLRVLRVAGAVVLLAVIGALVGRTTYKPAEAEEGDIRLTAQGIAFEQESLEAESGTVAVFLDNKDQTLHTFTIDDLDISLQVPSTGKGRIEFDATAGEYEFYCIPHESTMKGTLTVE